VTFEEEWLPSLVRREVRRHVQTGEQVGGLFSKTHRFSDVWSSKREAAVGFETGEELGEGKKRGGKTSMKLRTAGREA